MNHLIEEKISELKHAMTEMGDLVSSQLERSYQALVTLNLSLAQEVLMREKRVDALELRIDQDCAEFLVLQQPMAIDFRFVVSTLKMNINMERIGDYAKGIAKLAMAMKAPPKPEMLEAIEFSKALETLLTMLHDVNRAYDQGDSQQARAVFQKDLDIDAIRDNSFVALKNYILRHPEDIEDALNLLIAMRKLERVGDHLTNIAEEVIYYLEADVLRHTKPKHKRT
jgi:phosphate transport system protein